MTTLYLISRSLTEGQIFRPSKNRNLFYKVIDKRWWLVKAVRYHPNRKPQGREHYGYETLPVSTLRHDKVLRSRVQEQGKM